MIHFPALAADVVVGRPETAAGEPLAEPQHTLEVTNSCPPAFRAENVPVVISCSAFFSGSASVSSRLSVAFSRRIVVNPPAE